MTCVKGHARPARAKTRLTSPQAPSRTTALSCTKGFLPSAVLLVSARCFRGSPVQGSKGTQDLVLLSLATQGLDLEPARNVPMLRMHEYRAHNAPTRAHNPPTTSCQGRCACERAQETQRRSDVWRPGPTCAKSGAGLIKGRCWEPSGAGAQPGCCLAS